MIEAKIYLNNLMNMDVLLIGAYAAVNIQKYDNHVQRLIDELMEKRARHDSSFTKTATKLLRRAQELEDEALIGFSCYYLAEAHYIYSMNHDNFKKNGYSCNGALTGRVRIHASREVLQSSRNRFSFAWNSVSWNGLSDDCAAVL